MSSDKAITDQILTPEEESQLREHGHEVSYPARTVVMRQGDESDFVLYLKRGHMRAVAPGTGVTITIHSADEMVGEFAALRRKPRTADVIAISDVDALLIPGDVWRAFIQSNLRASYAYLVNLTERHAMNDDVEGLSFTNSEHRIARAILRLQQIGLGVASDEGTTFKGISQRDLAGIAKVSRESAAAVLRTFRERGIVATGRQRFTVLDMDAIEHIHLRNRTLERKGGHERSWTG